ncbi:hypothetical protein HMPREF2564_04405 [Staphylococcus sp. HMSC068D03]|nr:hypothetical protein HMPREF2620_05480 [Staphylococcus sp. HMSC077B09]OHP79246.1 hypothetical protein HMPREF2544_07010 [Staphylococcus sp. HMSC063A11]OHQ34684.1 hypothetical protein HMPREF2564_04405 [Staphylococcus sp. HMSC068D03]OHR09388.1 hypothetical protein HMPREF2587_06865 [Staphylococcus sp. HMSC078A08]OHR99552.1 hypothetical protein HMPREF3246_06100 [Staphylococcus sp. HMSC36A02]
MFHSQVSHFSQIGVSVQEAEQNERYTVKHIPFGKQMVIEYKNETDAEMYVVLDEEKRLVGADIYGVDAADLVNLLVFIINQRITAQDLNKLIFAFPSDSSGVIDMLKVNIL